MNNLITNGQQYNQPIYVGEDNENTRRKEIRLRLYERGVYMYIFFERIKYM